MAVLTETALETPPTSQKRKHTREEMLAIFREFREAVQAHNPDRRNLEAELSAERRAEAERE